MGILREKKKGRNKEEEDKYFLLINKNKTKNSLPLSSDDVPLRAISSMSVTCQAPKL